MCVEGSTVAPPPGPARNRPLTGQHSCRQPAKVIVVKHTPTVQTATATARLGQHMEITAMEQAALVLLALAQHTAVTHIAINV